MEDKKGLFVRPIASMSISAAAVIISVFLIIGHAPNERGKNISFMITLAVYGTGAVDMERLAAIPLEDALSGIPDIKRILTFSENSRVRAFVKFKRSSPGSYDALREAAQQVYETMPPWAQRPVLSSSDDSAIPVWTAAVIGDIEGEYLEKVIKPALEGLEGTAEVEIAGTEITEILVIPDPEKTALLGLSPSDIAAAMNTNDGIFPGGKVKSDGREFPVKIYGRYADSSSMGEAWINHHPGKTIRLKDIASVIEQGKDEAIISRLDGKKAAVITIRSASGADLGTLSRAIRKTLKKITEEKTQYGAASGAVRFPSFEFRVLRDLGAEEEKAFYSVLTATAEAALLVALSAVLLTGKNQGRIPALVCALSIPFIAVVSAALLSCLGLAVNKKLLAGLSIGIGTAVDAVIVCADGFEKENGSGARTLLKLMPPLVSGAATTIAALFPLASFSEVEEMTPVVWALGAVTMVSLTASLTVLPPLFLWQKKLQKSGADINKHSNTTVRKYFRSFQRIAFKKIKRLVSILLNFCLDKPFLAPAAVLIIVFLGVAALVNTGVDISENKNGDSIYARVEFDGGFHREEADRILIAWTNEIKKHEEIVSVQTSVRTGSAQILVNFDPERTSDKYVRELIQSSKISEGFIHIPETAEGEQHWEIKISGDNDNECRRLAEEAAFLCSTLPEIKDTILNFKTGNPRFKLVPQRELFAEQGLRFSTAAGIVRGGTYGPVVYKRPGEKGETDVRLKLMQSSALTPEETLSIPVIKTRESSTYSISKTGTLFSGRRDNEPSIIKRENRRRTASFTVMTPSMDPRKIRDNINRAVKEFKLPPGYVMEFDEDAISRAEAMTGTVLLFFLALVFCYMIIAAANESLLLPLIILSSVPPSLAIPVLLLILSGSPINSAVCCSLIAVSGITVNASVIVAGEFTAAFTKRKPSESHIYHGLIRKCLPCLLAVCGTTMSGAVPFLFLRGDSNSMFRVLSMITFTGTGVSFLTSITLIPSLLKTAYQTERMPRS